MRFNVQKGGISDDDAQKNKKLKEAYSLISKSLQKDYNINNQIVVGTIKVDEHSRLTLSKKIKTVFPIFPGDTIVVYQDLINNNLLFKVQRNDEISDTWIIKRHPNDAISPFYSDNDDNTNTALAGNKNILTNFSDDNKSNQQLATSTFNIMIIDDDSDILIFIRIFFCIL
jgi:hypothetical protein